MVAGKYAQVRIQLCELADYLAEHDADVVLSVIKKLIPVIKERVKSLEDYLDITSDYSFHMERQDEKDMQLKQNGRIRVVESDWKKC